MPLHINDLSGLKHSGKQIIASLRKKVIELQVQNSVLEAKLRQMEGRSESLMRSLRKDFCPYLCK